MIKQEQNIQLNAPAFRLKQLQLFVATAEILSFSRVAEIFGVSQPTVSNQIAELEAMVGKPLFVRNRHTVQLTADGAALLRESAAILRRVNHAVQKIKQVGVEDYSGGTLKIGFEQLYRREIITQTTMYFKMQHPNVSCILCDAHISKILASISNGTMDLGFIVLPKESLSPTLAVEKLEDDVLCMVAAKPLVTQNSLEHFLGLAECLPIYLLDRDSRSLYATIRACRNFNITPHLNFLGSIREILIDVEAGNGVTILPRNVLSCFSSSSLAYHSIEREGVDARLTLAACWKKSRATPLGHLFLDIYRQQLNALTS